MNYDFDKEINKILDKTFKSGFSGYNADEVDAFFEEVIVYIKQVRELPKKLSSQLAAKDKEIAKLFAKIQALEITKKDLEERIKNFEENGYSNFQKIKKDKE